MTTEDPIRSAGGLLVAVMALAGCVGAGGAAITAPSSAPTAPSPSPTPTASPTYVISASPSPSGAVLDDRLTFEFPPEELDAVMEPTGCFMGMGESRTVDPRVAGDYRTIICWGEDEGVFLGVWVIWNERGSWEGPYRGTIDAARNHVIDSAMSGFGEYAELLLQAHNFAGSDDSIWDIDYTVANAAEPVLSPDASTGAGRVAVAGSRSCGVVVVDPVETSDSDVTQRRGEVRVCTWSASDPRLTGASLAHVSSDVRADGSAVGWGSLALQVGDGTWLGSYSLERTADGRTTVSTSLTGFDAYDGLLYRDMQVGPGDTTTITGWITEAR